MKHLLSIAITCILYIGLSLPAKSQVLETKLRVTVVDNLGNFVESAQVILYATESDYRANINPITSCPTDKKGRVVFDGLKAVPYYIDASKDEQNNNGEGVKTEALAPKKLNKVNTVIQ